MSEQLLTILRLGLLALIYIFFLRVLHAVWIEVHGPRRSTRSALAPPPAAPAVAGAVAVGAPTAGGAQIPNWAAATPVVHTLVVVEPSSLAGQRFTVDGDITIGRAPGCVVRLDDTYVSQVHARIAATSEGCLVEDLGSTNGTYLNRVKVTAIEAMQPGDRLQVGNVIMELR